MESQTETVEVTSGIIPNILHSSKQSLLQALRERNLSPTNKAKKSLINYALYFNKKYTRNLQFSNHTQREEKPTPPNREEIKVTTTTNNSPIKVYDLSAWKVKYNGQTNIEDFIYKVEETANIRGISLEILHKNFIDLISPEIFSWHKTHKKKTKCWSELKAALLQSFGKTEAQHKIKLNLLSIKQSPKETTAQYSQRAEEINDKLLIPLPESELLPVIIDGLSERYENIITSQKISSLAQLKEVCLLLELYQDRRKASVVTHDCPKPSLSSAIKPENNERKHCSFCKKQGHELSNCFKHAKILEKQDSKPFKRPTSEVHDAPQDNLRAIFKRSKHNYERIGVPDNFVKPPTDFSRPPPNWFKKPKN